MNIPSWVTYYLWLYFGNSWFSNTSFRGPTLLARCTTLSVKFPEIKVNYKSIRTIIFTYPLLHWDFVWMRDFRVPYEGHSEDWNAPLLFQKMVNFIELGSKLGPLWICLFTLCVNKTIPFNVQCCLCSKSSRCSHNPFHALDRVLHLLNIYLINVIFMLSVQV